MKIEFTTDKNVFMFAISDGCFECPFHQEGYSNCFLSKLVTISYTEIPPNCLLRDAVFVYKLKDE